MTNAANEQLKADGWITVEDDGFIDLVGPLWERCQDGVFEYALVAQTKHRNRRGLVQGGLLMTMADRTSGICARHGSGAAGLATVQMDTHFIDAARIGDVLISKPRVVRATKSLIFTSTEISTEGRCVILAHGVFKVMRAR